MNGTINDLAMCGARPLYLSAGFILEEGLDLDVLRRIVDSMAKAAYVANEGRFVAFVRESQADRAVAIMHGHEVAKAAARIGAVSARESSMVVLKTVLGTHRILDLLSGEQLPRIC